MRRHTGHHRPGSVPDDTPLALVETGSRGIRITSVNRAAAVAGIRAGVALSDARAGHPGLVTRPAEPEADHAALVRLAGWLGRYGPARNAAVLPAPSPLASLDHGLWADVAGVEHLYGGEAALLADMARRLTAMGLTARLGLADTSGAAYALARHGPRGGARGAGAAAVAPPGGTAAALEPLPVEALRLAPETVLLLRRLGLKRIGQLYGLPRGALERRFHDAAPSKARRVRSGLLAGALLARLDEVLGPHSGHSGHGCAEALDPLTEPPVLAVRRAYAEPFISSELLLAEVERITADLSAALQEAGLGARHVRLSLYRADGTTAEVSAGTSAPCHDVRHLVRLLAEKLGAIDAGFGIDALALEAVRAESAPPMQTVLAAGADRSEGITELIDRLANRLGAGRVSRLEARASHIPEGAERRVPAVSPAAKAADGAGDGGAARPRAGPPRPPLLLPRPEPIEVMAEVPEGAPLRFTWRRLNVRVVRAEGPERIAPEWWRDIGRVDPPPDEAPAAAGDDAAAPDHDHAPGSRPRDYYRVEAEGGGGYWVFRRGLYGESGGAPRWFLHGLYG